MGRVVRMADRLNSIAGEVLSGLVAPEDDVRYEVFIEAGSDEEDQPGVEVECEACQEVHPPITMYVVFTVAVVQPSEAPSSTFRAHSIQPILDMDDDDEVAALIERLWFEIGFQRQASAMQDLDASG
jgi:hypothetical protein